jgi:hypothetical protein
MQDLPVMIGFSWRTRCLGQGLKESAQAEAKPRRRVLTIIECSLQCEATPFPARTAIPALRANMNSSFFIRSQ